MYIHSSGELIPESINLKLVECNNFCDICPDYGNEEYDSEEHDYESIGSR